MKKIIITIPQKDDEKWGVTFGGGSFKRDSAAKVYNYVERELSKRLMQKDSLGSRMRRKTCVLVKYGGRYSKGDTNESLVSDNAGYLLFTLACFLEDYLNPKTLNQKCKKYGKYADDY